MTIERVLVPAFSVIGIEGSTRDGEGFIQRLWAEANARFDEVAPLAKRGPDGGFAGFWGAMSDGSRSFRPWTNGFTQGLYLAGVECADGVEAPEGWTKWDVPGFTGLRAVNDAPDVFPRVIELLRRQGQPLAGAAHDFIDPATGREYVYFPLILGCVSKFPEMQFRRLFRHICAPNP